MKMKKLRILHVIGGGEYGGAEQHIVHLLSTLPKDKVDAAVVCFYDSAFAAQLRQADIPVITLHQYGRFDLRLLFGLKRTFFEYKPDIIHSHGVKANFFSRLAARGICKVLLTTVHSYLRFDYANPLAYLIVSIMERTTRRWNDHYIAVSGALGDILQREGIPASSISVIYNGLDLKPFQKTEQAAQQRARLHAEWGISPDEYVFGSVARLVPVKGITYLLDAFAQVIQTEGERKFRLVLVGDGPERAALEEKARSLQIAQSVTFAGFRRDIPVCLRAFDAFVHSSIFEGLGYTIIEAMAAEVPVVATNVGGVKEFVVPRSTGLLVEPENIRQLASAMQAIASDPQLCARMTKEALALVENKFTIEQMGEQTLALYRKLLT